MLQIAAMHQKSDPNLLRNDVNQFVLRFSNAEFKINGFWNSEINHSVNCTRNFHLGKSFLSGYLLFCGLLTTSRLSN